jgi:hypothetical protein
MAATSNPSGSPVIRDLTPKPHEGQGPKHSESGNFEKLAGKLVQVPKTEVDEQRQKS